MNIEKNTTLGFDYHTVKRSLSLNKENKNG
jgi:hypothetical protein